MNSCIYNGKVRHRRHRPVTHAFQYSLFMMYLDLDELPHLFDSYRLWSYEKNNVATWRRRDYLGPRDLPLSEAIRYRVKHQAGVEVTGPIRMLCHMAYFGYCYNPVVFYYCYDRTDTRVETIIAEITNTPWGERHAYVLPESMNQNDNTRKRYIFPKQFHVSPFMPMDITNDWRFTEPGKSLHIHMQNHDHSGKVFDATLSLSRLDITAKNLARTLAAHPLTTYKVITMIHWQALCLWVKRVPFIEHPTRRSGDDKDPYATQNKAARFE
ncbi:MAG: DUF1365 domain-containing protein [Kiritimatiellae bacterium]|nr:DUF1365 domain-containing protein [Kiritimatiellia bacterium]